MAYAYPPIFINKYLQEKLGVDSYGNSLPFFPTTPTNLEDLTSTFPDGQFAVYDRMLKYRRNPFPHIKSEQLLYYFYKTVDGIEKLIENTQKVQDLLDREDESAQEINAWIKAKINSDTNSPNYGLIDFGTLNNPEWFEPVFFHNIKVYQLEETRDIVDFATARTYAGNKIIIDYNWHKKA